MLIGGEIRSTVTDNSGAVLPDLKVTMTNLQTAASRLVTTNSARSYGLSDIPPDYPVGPVGLEPIRRNNSSFVPQRHRGIDVGSVAGREKCRCHNQQHRKHRHAGERSRIVRRDFKKQTA